MKPSEHTFTSLIDIEGNQWHYHIPRFQRDYVWRRDNWSKLLEDIYENDPGHYMGSVICVHDGQELTPSTELVYEVVDGQQRLTTLSLMLCAIYKKLNELSAAQPDLVIDETFIVKRNSIKARLVKPLIIDTSKKLSYGIFKSGQMHYCLRVQPSTQNKNLLDYQSILNEIGVLPEVNRPMNLGNRIIYKCFAYFYEQLPVDLTGIYDLLSRIYKLSFIHILEVSQAKAFMLFETLNYRGVPLSAIDIIKNKMLATLENKHEVSINLAYEQWQSLLEFLPDETIQTRFLRHFYNAFKHSKQIKIETINRATGSNIISIYETLIKQNAKLTLEQLINKGALYNQFIEPEKYPKSDLTAALIDLARIGAAPAYSFLLYLFSLPDESFVNQDVKTKTIKLLCKYYFRRNVTDYPGTNILDAINIELVETCQKILSEGQKLDYSLISRAIFSIKEQPSTLAKLKEALGDNLFYNNSGMARYAITRLDESFHNREYAPNLWERNEKGLFLWTVEHIFPQGQTIPTDWVDMIANGNRKDAEKIQGEYVHCLGNLTLSAYNSNLSNFSFAKKQEKAEANVFNKSIYIGYKNGLYLNNIPFQVQGKTNTLATAQLWDLDHIKSRNEAMVELLINLFRFENESEN